MTTLATALAAFQARIADPVYAPVDGDSAEIPRWWQDDNNVLPDTPAPFIFFEIIAVPGQAVSYGGGRGANRYRNAGELNAYVMVPRGQGLATMAGYAEQVAAAFRSYRTTDISCFNATVMPIGDGASLVPPGLSGADVAGNYSCCVCSVDFFYDTIG